MQMSTHCLSGVERASMCSISSTRHSLPSRPLTPLRTPTSRRTQRAAPVNAAAFSQLDIASTITHADAMLTLMNTNPELALQQLLHFADAAVQVAPTAASAANTPQDNGWLTPLVESLELVLRFFQTGLDKYSVPYSYGWSIVALTASVKLATFPLTKTQVESTMSMQSLKPKIDIIKAKYGDNKEAVSRETSALYEKAGVNPLAGCLPTVATIPIFIGLYRSLTSVAATGELDNEGFYWIPSLAGPTTAALQKAGAGTAWLFPFVDGAPPIGWDSALRYLAIPIALVIAQYISSAIIAPPVDPNAENQKVQKALYYALPLMVGWFSLNLPAGLSLYYISNTVLTSAQQIFLRKLGGANISEFDLGPIELGKARRTGTVSSGDITSSEEDAQGFFGAENGAESSNGNGAAVGAPALAYSDGAMVGSDTGVEGGMVSSGEVLAAAVVVPMINKRCKRKKRELLEA